MVWKKVAVLLDFVQITSTPPPQNLDNLYHFFLTPTCQKILAGVTVPLPPHPQIDPLYTVCEKLTKNLGRALPSPPHLDKIQKNSYFFLGNHPSLTEHDFYRKSLDILEAWRILQRIKGSLPQLLQ